jgi:O-antigen/teichoic acid export membrane protein
VNVILRNGLSLVSSQATVMLIALVLLVVVPDYLGDVDFGRFAFSLVFVGLFGIVGTFGTGMFLTRATARDPALIGPYISSTIVLKLLMAAVLSTAALALAAVLGYDREMMLLIAAACVSMTITLVNETAIAGLYGLQRMGRPAVWGVVGQLAAAILGITAVLMNAGVVVYAFVIAPAFLIPLTANVNSLWPELRHAGGVDVRIWRVVLVGGFPFLVMTGIQIVYGSIDMVMLRPLAGDATVGWYALAYRWISLPVLLASTCMLAVFPALSVRSLEQDDQFSRLANRALMFVAFIGFPAATGIALVADDIISMTYHGQFRETIPLMRILALSIPLVVIDMVLGMVMFASDRQKQWMILGAVTMFINPAINIFAIPYAVDHFDNGAIGAATATVVTELVVLGGALVLVPRGVMDRATTSFVLRCLAAAATMAVIVLALGDIPLAAKIVVGVLSYAAATLLFRVATRAELEWFRSHLSARSASPESSPPSTASPVPTSTLVE